MTRKHVYVTADDALSSDRSGLDADLLNPDERPSDDRRTRVRSVPAFVVNNFEHRHQAQQRILETQQKQLKEQQRLIEDLQDLQRQQLLTQQLTHQQLLQQQLHSLNTQMATSGSGGTSTGGGIPVSVGPSVNLSPGTGALIVDNFQSDGSNPSIPATSPPEETNRTITARY